RRRLNAWSIGVGALAVPVACLLVASVFGYWSKPSQAVASGPSWQPATFPSPPQGVPVTKRESSADATVWPSPPPGSPAPAPAAPPPMAPPPAAAAPQNPSNRVTLLKGHRGMVESAVFSPDGRLALSGSQDRTVCIWDVETGKLVRTLVGHSDTI